jgi:hypothetical protein
MKIRNSRKYVYSSVTGYSLHYLVFYVVVKFDVSIRKEHRLRVNDRSSINTTIE